MVTYLTRDLGGYASLQESRGSLPFTSIVLNSNRTWTFTWASTDANVYRVVLNGVQLAVVANATTYTFTSAGYDKYPPPLEVVEFFTPALSELNLPYIVLQWYWVQCASFIVQQYISGQWVQKTTINNNGSWVYTWTSLVLPDETTQQFRVVAVDAIGQQSPALLFQQKIVRVPNLVETSISVGYDKPTLSITVSGS